MDELESLKSENEKLKEQIAQYKIQGAVGFFYELNRFINDATGYIRSINVKSLIDSDEKGDKKFDRTIKLIEVVEKQVGNLDNLKEKLGLTGDRKKDTENAAFIETVATKRD